MPLWCPKCHAMLPEGLEKCPSCGVKLCKPKSEESDEEFSRADYFWYSAYTIGVVLIPIIVVIGISLLCLFLYFR